MNNPIIKNLKKIKSDAFTLAFYPLFVKVTTKNNETIKIPYKEIIAIDSAIALVFITKKKIVFVSYVTGNILEKELDEEEGNRLIIRS